MFPVIYYNRKLKKNNPHPRKNFRFVRRHRKRQEPKSGAEILFFRSQRMATEGKAHCQPFRKDSHADRLMQCPEFSFSEARILRALPRNRKREPSFSEM